MSHTQNTDERYPEHRDAPQDTGPYAGATPGAPRNEYQPDAPRDEYDQSQHGRAAAGEYQPATHGATAGDYAGQGYDQSQHDKPSMGQKILGSAEKMMGKATGKPELAERGHERKNGGF